MSRRRKPSEEDDNPGFVTRREFNQTVKPMKKDILTIRTALVGEDYRGGVVKDVADLKKEKSLLAQTIKSVVVPILVAVVTAFILTAR